MSVGRAQSQHLRDSLPAHPLLSPAPSANSTPTLTSAPSPASTSNSTGTTAPSSTPPKYVPYTPRHRPIASTSSASAPTSTNATASPTSSGVAGGATRELQRQNMKAEIQALGLGADSAGWGMLERLSSLPAADEEWEEIWGMITVGKATLLLPKEALAPNEITPDLVRDHVVFSTASSSSSSVQPSPLVTLAGLRGIVDGPALTFRSTLPAHSTQFTQLIAAPTRAPTLQGLPPLPRPLTPHQAPPYPGFTLAPSPSPIPLPPRPSPVPPPLPTRPPKPAHHTGGRLSSLPFSSLFGSKPAPAPAPAQPATPTPAPASTSTTPPPHAPAAAGEGPTIEVWPVDRVLRTREIAREISKAVRGEIKAALAGLPGWLPDRVTAFVAPYLPVSSKPPKPSKLRTSIGHGAAGTPPPPPSPSPTPEMDPTPEAFQAFYAALYADLQLYYEHSSSPTGSLLLRRGSKELERDREREREKDELDEKDLTAEGPSSSTSADPVRAALDTVESVVCTLLFDRLFRPADSDDERHDEALASRVAALNMLDLGLEHLGVDVVGGGSKVGVEEVVRACGQELQKLPHHQAPKDKSAILVAAHKLVADGLARLPPLVLRPEGEVEEKTARPAVVDVSPGADGHGYEHEYEGEYGHEHDHDHDHEGDVTARPRPAGKAMAMNGAGVHEGMETEMQEHVNGSAAGVAAALAAAAGEDHVFAGSRSPGGGGGQDAFVRTPPPVPALRFPPELLQDGGQAESEDDHAHPPPLPPRHASVSPARTRSSRSSPAPQATSSADLMLPLIIFAVVKSNPAQLVSHLLYVQRYRDSTVGGEENYCLINLSAVVEFLEHVDLGVLGLGGQEKVLSIDDLTPIPLVRSPQAQAQAEAAENIVGGRLRGTVSQVGELAASTNKVISGVVDSSFSALRGLLSQSQAASASAAGEPLSPEAGGDLAKIARPGFGLLRRASGFSIASMAASLPGGHGHGRARSMHGREGDEDEEGGRPLVEVNSRAGSIREEVETDSEEEGSEEEEDGTSGQTEDDEGEGEEGEGDREGETEGEGEAELGEEEGGRGYRSDVRSVRSFSSMMSRESRERDERRERMSIHDRLASMAQGRFGNKLPGAPADAPGSGRKASPARSRRTSLLSPSLPQGNSHARTASDSRSPSPGESPSGTAPGALPLIPGVPLAAAPAPTPVPISKVAGPSSRFMACSPDELRLSEIGELLREYRRVVGALRAVGGFEEGGSS